MDMFRNPDEVLKEVEDKEERREEQVDVEKALDESPKDQDEDSEGDED